MIRARSSYIPVSNQFFGFTFPRNTYPPFTVTNMVQKFFQKFSGQVDNLVLSGNLETYYGIGGEYNEQCYSKNQ